jgi:hypothetical protein
MHAFIVVLFTLLTQIGGLLWVICLPLGAYLRKRFSTKLARFRPKIWLTPAVFLVLYTLITVLVVPPIARSCFNRVPLPVYDNPHLEPENIYFSYFNRAYVKPELRKTLETVAEEMQIKFPGAAIWYLDANFPLIEGYPLEPHLTHRDGKKVDIAFYWKDAKTGKAIRKNPSPSGYGLWAEPYAGEFDYAKHCMEQGYWYIGMDGDLTDWFYNANDYTFDAERNAELLRLLAINPAIKRILIQPHLKKRLGLEGFNKIRSQGCHAARHDDHMHVELR